MGDVDPHPDHLSMAELVFQSHVLTGRGTTDDFDYGVFFVRVYRSIDLVFEPGAAPGIEQDQDVRHRFGDRQRQLITDQHRSRDPKPYGSLSTDSWAT